MDPSTLVKKLVHEIALDGIYGTSENRLWDLCAQEFSFPLDPELKNAIWEWIADLPNIKVEDNRTLRATEELQWLTLTGHPQSENVVGNLTFELLCLIAHSRAAGISTVEASKSLGQDLRSLFGRVQTLANLGLVVRFPVIENGSSTNRMLYHLYAGSHNISEAAVDKEAILKQIVEFCKTGIEGIRTSKNVINEIGSTLVNTKKSRRRPTVVGCVRVLESLGCVRRISMAHSDYPDRRYSCIEYVKDFETSKTAFRSENGLCAVNSVIYGPDNSLDNEDDNAADGHKGDETNDDDLESNLSDTEENIPQANTIYPFPNQIYDAVHAAGSQGISAMDITSYLTGVKYRKALSKYLDGITAPPSSGPLGELPQIGHLTLIKGVDFDKRVKFYRYFSKMAYKNTGENPEEWGAFLPDPQVDTSLSLKALDRKLSKPLPGVCTVVKLPNGELKAVFHGDKEVQGEVVLRSGPTDSALPTDAAQPRKRGRPRKTDPKVKKEPSLKPPPPPSNPLDEKPLLTVPLNLRKWTGGTPVESSRRRPSSFLQPQAQPNLEPVKVESNDVNAPKTAQPTDEKDIRLGSLAMRQRAETLLSIVSRNDGLVLGGSTLLEKFNDAVSNQYKIDRRTVNNVVEKVVTDRKLEKLYVSVPTNSGKHVMKFILYDPLKHPNPESSPAIAQAKHELTEGGRERHIQATRAALDAAKSALKRAPAREMTEEQLKVFGPKSVRTPPNRILSTSSSKARVPRAKTKFGPSAAEVLGVDASGQSTSRAKRPARKEAKVEPESHVSEPEMDDNHMDIDPNLVAESPKLKSKPPGRVPRSLKPASASEAKRSQKPEPDLEKLARSVVVFRSLFSSGKAYVDWKIIAHSMNPPMTATEARRRWPEAKNTLEVPQQHSQTSDPVVKKSLQFEELFLKAYERGLVEYEADQDPLVAIPEYVSWWQRVDATESLKQSLLKGDDESKAKSKEPESKASQMVQYLEGLSLQERKFENLDFDPLSALQSQVSIVNAEKLLNKTTFGASIGDFGQIASDFSDAEMRLRAVMAADGGSTYSPEKAAKELRGMTNKDTELAKAGLELKRVIQWGESDLEKVPKGRPYVLNEQVLSTLTVPKLDHTVPRLAVKNAAWYSQVKEGVEIPEAVDETAVMPLIELNTFGLHGKKAKLRRLDEKFGLLSTDYKSRGIDKQEFEGVLVIDVVNTNKDGEVQLKSPYIKPPKSGNEMRPWLWETQYLTSTSIWFKVAYRILTMVHFRPGMTAGVIALSLKNALEFEETLGAVNALIKGGALENIGHGGLRTTPNWLEFLFYSLEE